jgi:RecA/RadA recombinase
MSSLFKSALEEIKEELCNEGVLEQYGSNTLCIKVPSLAFRYLIQYEGLPLSKFILVTGPHASYKSTLCLEIAKWHLELGGEAVLFDTEGASSTLHQAVLGQAIFAKEYQFMEDWIDALVRRVVPKFKQAINAGVHAPVCFIIDSIIGSESKKTSNKLEEDVNTLSSYPLEAKLLSGFLKHKNSILLNYPFTLLATNHIKESINPYGGPEKYIPGGRALTYHAQLILEMHKEKAPELKSDSYESALRITVTKNRFGPEKNSIIVPFVIKQAGIHETILVARFLWNTATVKMLHEGAGFNIRIKDKLLNKIRSVINIESKSAGSKGIRYFCKELGVSRESAISAEELGKMIESNQQLLEELYKVLMIRKATFIEPKNVAVKETSSKEDVKVEADEANEE